MKTASITEHGVTAAITAILDNLAPKRDPILGRIVTLPAEWQTQHGYTADWAKDITQGRVIGRGMDTDWNTTGDISVVLLSPDGTETGHSVSFEQWELSLAQQGIKEA